jgi:hypothetical protein
LIPGGKQVAVGVSMVAVQRTAGLVVRVQGDETLVLDTRTGTAHCLPDEVGRVWNACASRRTLTDVAIAAGVDENVAAASIEQLLEADLLEGPAGLDRRKFLRRSAMVGGSALAIPVIQSVIGPIATAAASPPPPTCHSVITQLSSCSGQKAQYTLSVSGLAPNTSYNVTVTYKNGTVSDNFGITSNGTGAVTSPVETTGAAVPHGGVQDVEIQVFTLAGVLVCQDTGLVFNQC